MKDIFQYKDIVLAIEEEHSFSNAAKKLYISQPSLSAMVKKLEKEIGSPLFDRNYKPPRLTEIGYEYLRIAKQMKDTETDFEDYINSISRLDAGTLRIGSSQSLFMLELPRYVSDFSNRHPNVHLSLIEEKTNALNAMLENGDLDLVINCNEINNNLFESKDLKTEHLLIAIHKSFDVNKQIKQYALTYDDILKNIHTNDEAKAVDLKFFSNVPFIYLKEGNDTRTRMNILFKENFINPPCLFELDHLSAAFTYASLANAAAFVSDTVVKGMQTTWQNPENVLYYKIDSPLSTRTVSVAYKKSRYLSKAMKAFIDTLSSLE